MTAEPEIRFITVGETLPLRSRVLLENRPLEQSRFAEDGQPGSFHLGCFCSALPSKNPLLMDHGLLGIASYYAKDLEGQAGRGFQLRGMAVVPALQRGGLGGALLAFGERHVRALGRADFLWCNARVKAIPFYERHGWRVIGGEFQVPEAGPHRRMVKLLRG